MNEDGLFKDLYLHCLTQDMTGRFGQMYGSKQLCVKAWGHRPRIWFMYDNLKLKVQRKEIAEDADDDDDDDDDLKRVIIN